jgi:hypothetical protein
MRCPVCKADNPHGPQCRRCKADLSLLFELEEQRGQALAETWQHLHQGEWSEAARQAEAVDWLRGDEESKRLAALAHLLEGDFAATWRRYQDWLETGRDSQ